MKVESRYVHDEVTHNFDAAEQIVPYLLKFLDSKSVVDVGCGTGTWLKVFQDHNVTDILGIDGDYMDKSMLKIDSKNFLALDLENKIQLNRKYELAICLEVAEHLSEASSDSFIETLTNLSNTIVFSAAVPGQGGQNHINEREPKYWIEKFQEKGYTLHDILRPVFWEDKKVEPWYRQNMLLFTNQEQIRKRIPKVIDFNGAHLIHPHLSHEKDYYSSSLENKINRIKSGTIGITFALKILLKSLLKKFIKN